MHRTLGIDMVDKPTSQQFVDDLVRSLEALQYATHIRIWPEGQITIDCKDGTLILRASIRPTNVI
jgi:hypothetical protein